MKFKDLKRSLQNEPVKNVYLIFGNDEYLLQSAKKQIISACKLQNEEFNLISFDENELPQNVVAAASSYPFMSDKKIIIFNIAKSTNLHEIENYAENPVPVNVLLLISRTQIKTKNKNIELVDCNFENADNVEIWAKGIAKAQGLQISFEALQLLCAFCGCCMSRIVSEIEKLKYIKREILPVDIEKNVSKDIEYQIYEISNCLQNKNGKEMEILQDILKKNGVSVVPLLISSIFSYYKRIYITKTSNMSDEEIASLTLQKPYSIKIARKNGQNLSLHKIINNINAIADYDFAFKSGKMSAETAIMTALMKCR